MLKTLQVGLMKVLIRNPESLQYVARLADFAKPAFELWREYESRKADADSTAEVRELNKTSQ